VIALLLLALAGIGALAVVARRALFEPLAFAAPGEGRVVEIRTGESARGILERLERDGLLRSAWLTRLYLTRIAGDPPLLAGEYRLESPLSALQVLDRLRSGDVVTYPVTLVEGWTYLESADALARAGFASREALVAAFGQPARIAGIDRQASNLEGYLYPDTYRFPRGVTAETIADTLVARFRRVWSDQIAPLRAPGDERSPRELVVLASLVEKEARLDSERPLIAAVYANRLRRKIGLYADPTIIYGLKLAGRWDGNLRRADLEADSPWNTYLRPGLPPGPICSPGRASLAAAMRPADVEFLYFVSRNDGSHVFSTTLAEHNRNVEIWQREYFRRRRSQH